MEWRAKACEFNMRAWSMTGWKQAFTIFGHNSLSIAWETDIKIKILIIKKCPNEREAIFIIRSHHITGFEIKLKIEHKTRLKQSEIAQATKWNRMRKNERRFSRMKILNEMKGKLLAAQSRQHFKNDIETNMVKRKGEEGRRKEQQTGNKTIRFNEKMLSS